MVEAQSLAASKCEHAWRTQRKANDWKGFAQFEAVVKTGSGRSGGEAERQRGQFTTPYEAMLDLYAEGDTEAFIAKAFAGLKQTLPELGTGDSGEAEEATSGQPDGGITRLRAQKKLSLKVMEVLGFNFDRRWVGCRHPPFSTGVHGDHKLPPGLMSEFVQALMATVHETGHASYEAICLQHGKSSPLVGRSMSLHESQSLLFEKQIFLSRPFLSF